MDNLHKAVEKAAMLAKVKAENNSELIDDVAALIQMADNILHIDSIILPYGNPNGHLREDSPQNRPDTDELLRNAPDIKDGFFKVPKTVG